MKKYIIHVIAAFALSLFSCVDGGGKPDEGIPVTISLDAAARANSAGSQQAGSDEDIAINSLRVLVYKSSGGQLMWNHPIFIDGGSPVKPIPLPPSHEIDIRTGTYDFVFIANEHSATSLDFAESNRAAFDTWTELRGMKFAAAAFDADKDIPMVKVYRGVTVRGDRHLDYYDDGGSIKTVDVTDGSEDAGVWTVPVERAGVRLSMTIEMDDDMYAAWADKKIYIGNIPGYVWLLPGIDNSASQPDPMVYADFAASEDEDDDTPGYIDVPGLEPGWGGPDDPLDPGAIGGASIYTVTYDRIILPELLFTPVGTEAKALVLMMDMGVKRTAKIFAPASAGLGYTLPRNSWLHLDVTATDRMFELNVLPRPWELWDYPGNEIELK